MKLSSYTFGRVPQSTLAAQSQLAVDLIIIITTVICAITLQRNLVTLHNGS